MISAKLISGRGHLLKGQLALAPAFGMFEKTGSGGCEQGGETEERHVPPRSDGEQDTLGGSAPALLLWKCVCPIPKASIRYTLY